MDGGGSYTTKICEIIKGVYAAVKSSMRRGEIGMGR